MESGASSPGHYTAPLPTLLLALIEDDQHYTELLSDRYSDIMFVNKEEMEQQPNTMWNVMSSLFLRNTQPLKPICSRVFENLEICNLFASLVFCDIFYIEKANSKSKVQAPKSQHP